MLQHPLFCSGAFVLGVARAKASFGGQSPAIRGTQNAATHRGLGEADEDDGQQGWK